MQTPVQVGFWVPTGPTGPRVANYIEVRWRDLTLVEHQRIRSRPVHERLRWCEVYETCLVKGPPLSEVPAGIVVWIATQQLEQNPFSEQLPAVRKALYQARARVESTWFLAAKAVLASTFRYTFEEIDAWPPSVFFERVAQAEMLTGVPLEPADGSEKSKGRNNKVRRMPSPDQPQQQQAPGRNKGNVDRSPQQHVEENNWTNNRRRR